MRSTFFTKGKTCFGYAPWDWAGGGTRRPRLDTSRARTFSHIAEQVTSVRSSPFLENVDLWFLPPLLQHGAPDESDYTTELIEKDEKEFSVETMMIRGPDRGQPGAPGTPWRSADQDEIRVSLKHLLYGAGNHKEWPLFRNVKSLSRNREPEGKTDMNLVNALEREERPEEAPPCIIPRHYL